MYKLRTFEELISASFKQSLVRVQLQTIRHFKQKPYLRETTIRDENFQYSALDSAFKANQIKTLEDWAFLRKDLTERIRQITVTNFEAIALGYCFRIKDFKLAELCIKFIQEENKLNLGVIGRMFSIYRYMHDINIFKGDYEDTVCKMYDNIRSKHKVLDSITLEAAIVALSATKRWNLCFDLLKEIRISNIPNSTSYNYTAAAAFKGKEYDLGWELVEEMMNNNRLPTDLCFKAILLDCVENKVTTNFHSLLDFFNKYDIVCSIELLNLIEQASIKFKCKPKSTQLSDNGKCSNCQEFLPRVNLSKDEFDDLKKAFFKEGIIGKNVFCKTTPEEVNRFKAFLKTEKKYHVIIDGLNVAYTTGSNNHIIMASTLGKVVDYFTTRGKQVLVLGRLHMLKWSHKHISQIQRTADVFLTHDLSYDDPYLLYCALHSGQDTIIVSKDYMRNQLQMLKKDQHRRLFKRWLVQCRYEFVGAKHNGKVIFTKPLPFLQNCQETEFGWHIPYLLDGETIVENGKIKNWLCIQK